jgi:hypothetical protein
MGDFVTKEKSKEINKPAVARYGKVHLIFNGNVSF